MSTSYREAAMAYNNIKDIDTKEEVTPSSGLLSRTNNKMSKDTNQDQPIDRVTRYVHTIRAKRNEMKNE
jgi:hypothetical protein|tara:strand:- start:283 stop:489 length:207 start_codon:yes stop_codon:yes gene_type:complete